MERRGHRQTSSAEPPHSTASKRKISSHHHLSKKRRRILYTSETENNPLTLIHNSTTTFTSHTHKYTNSHTYFDDSDHSRKRRKNRAGTTDNRRRWTYSPRSHSNYKDRIVLVSYNILGVANAANHTDLYTNVPHKFMDWNYRKGQLRKELKKYRPGIICFQEVDQFDDLANLLHKDGFRGVYQARTGEACDGCAIFWKDDLFTLVHDEGIEYRNFGLGDNVAQFCVFKMNQGDSDTDENEMSQVARSFVVGNIHVLYNPKRGDIKLGQMRMLLEKAEELSSEWGNIPVVIAGDLNSMPKSPMYQFLNTSELDIRLHGRRNISGQICPGHYSNFRSQYNSTERYYASSSRGAYKSEWSEEELWLATGGERDTLLRHHLTLRSAYAGVPGSTKTRDIAGEPLATSFNSKFLGTVDYIWHTKELVPVRVLETLPIDHLRKTRGLPSQKWGSDHLAIACELAFEVDS